MGKNRFCRGGSAFVPGTAPNEKKGLMMAEKKTTQKQSSSAKNGSHSGSGSRSSGGYSTHSNSTRSNASSRSNTASAQAKPEKTRAPEEVHREIGGIVLIVVGLILGIFCYFGSSGLLAAIAPVLFGLFGVAVYTLPVILVALGVLLIALPRRDFRPISIVCIAVIFLSVIALIHVFAKSESLAVSSFGENLKAAYWLGKQHVGGGVVGGIFASLFVYMLGSTGSIIALIGIILIAILLITHFSIRAYFNGLREKRELKLADGGAPSRKKQKLYGESLSGSDSLDDDGFIRHTGKPLTSGDTDYDYSPRKDGSSGGTRSTAGTRSTRSPARNANNYIDERKRAQREENEKKNAEWLPLRKHKPADDLEFLPISGPLEKSGKSRKHGKSKKVQSELKESFGFEAFCGDPLSADVETEFGDTDTAFGSFSIPLGTPKKRPASDDILEGVSISRYDPKPVSESSEEEESAKPAPVSVIRDTDDPKPAKAKIEAVETESDSEAVVIEQSAPEYVYQRPPINLLKLPDPTVAIGAESPEEKARVLIDTLKSFNIEAKIVNISIGPVITRFELQPAQGVRVNKITSLSNDIALALAAPRVRIEAPIPGKSAIGIEIPNRSTAPVLLRELIDTSDFNTAKSPLTFAVGKDIAGNAVYADLGKMPHMLVAGQTGSGKSVCINGIILSLVYKSSPKDVRMILIDPKVVELSIFSTIPHLFCPVVTEPKKAAGALRWAVNEMDQRYKRMAEVHARDIDRYNAVQTDEAERWPRLVIIIDELADLMIVAGKDVEESICRIAQLGRACGIHLIVATQRPSVDVITGLIKANIPSRIAFAVSNATDSRVILDSNGADKLLGRGDMLFHPNGAAKPTRAQGAFVGDEEVESVAEFFTKTTAQQPVFQTDMLAEITGMGGGSTPGQGNGKQEDELLPDAVRLVIESGAASISMIQRRLRVGYARAARLIDIMEQKHYVSEADGSKPRKVLLDAAGYNDIFGGEIASSRLAVDDGYDEDDDGQF